MKLNMNVEAENPDDIYCLLLILFDVLQNDPGSEEGTFNFKVARTDVETGETLEIVSLEASLEEVVEWRQRRANKEIG